MSVLSHTRELKTLVYIYIYLYRPKFIISNKAHNVFFSFVSSYRKWDFVSAH